MSNVNLKRLFSKQEEELIFEFLHWVKLTYAPKTYSHSVSAIGILAEMVNKYERSILELAPHEIEEYLHEKFYNTHSFNTFRGDFRRLYKFCVDRGFIARSPIIFRRAKEPKALPKPLTQAQQEKILKAARNIKWKFAIELTLNTGIRRDELIKLKMSDIDEAEMVLHVRARSQGGGGKGDKERIIPVTASLIDAYHNYLRECRINQAPNTWVFPARMTNNPKPSTGHNAPETFRRYLNRLSKKVKFKVTCHMLRHTLATNHVNKGTDIRILQIDAVLDVNLLAAEIKLLYSSA